MIRRRLFNIAAAVSLLLCVATMILWIRSYWRLSEISHVRNVYDPILHEHLIVEEVSESALYDDLGHIRIYHSRSNLRFGGFIVADGFHFRESAPTPIYLDIQWLHQRNATWTEWHHAGIHYRSEWTAAGFGGWDLQFPWAYVAVPMAILSFTTMTLRLKAWRRARAGTAGCPGCGYNLTANVSGVCPECGMVVSVSKCENPVV